VSSQPGWDKDHPLDDGESTSCRTSCPGLVEWHYTPIRGGLVIEGQQQVGFETGAVSGVAVVERIVEAYLQCDASEGHRNWYWVKLPDA
jgi:hypothetical protein